MKFDAERTEPELREELRRVRSDYAELEDYIEQAVELRDDVRQLKDQNKRLREALKPFAEDDCPKVPPCMTCAWCRARAVMDVL